jgi:predicted nicotinamide N-methyase
VEDPSTLYLHTKSTGRNELWARVWSTSRILAEMLAGQSSRGHLRGLETIEIGCGSALVGLVCARYGGNVLLTDSSEQALALVEQSAVLNKVEVRCARFDWHNIDPSVLSVDLLLGSDVLFVGSNVMAVIGVIRLLRPGALAVIVDPGRPSADDFVTKVSEESTLEMEVLEVEEPVVSANHKLKRVVLYLITVKCAVPNKQLADLKHGLVDSWGWIAQRTAAEGPSTYEYTERVEIRKP